MQGGNLKRRVTVQGRGTSTQDAFGEPSITWTTLATVWGDLEGLSGNELLKAQQVNSQTSHTVTVRYQPLFIDPKVVATYRLIYKGRIFNVHASINEAEQDRTICLYCSEGVGDGV